MEKDRRIELHKTLVDILGSTNVYFQPPETVKLKYPCIIYSRRKGDTQFAGNKPYIYNMSYDVTVIDSNPDSEIPEKIAAIPQCISDRHYTADNLNHDTFVLYY